jgi:DNA-binding GntR family transcriptional regulator
MFMQLRFQVMHPPSKSRRILAEIDLPIRQRRLSTKSALAGADTLVNETLVIQAERLLHQDIVNGVHAAGARLNIRELAARYDIGATPIREALTKLSANGFVAVIENRGFRVASLSAEDLVDIVSARQLIEIAALRLSMRDGDAEWEAGIAGTLRKIEHFASSLQTSAEGWGAELDVVHKQFHTALLQASGSPRLINMHQIFYDQTFRYRQTMFTRMPSLDDFVQDHRELAQLVLARNVDAACRRLSEHLTHTLKEVYPGVTLPDPSRQ